MGGAFAQYVCVPEKLCGLMPAAADFSQMASVPVAGLTALQALTTHGKLQKGERVLINGASGGVGHIAVQIAKAYGAEVTAVCSSKNISFVKELGADHVIAYDQENIHQHKGNYDLLVDVNGNLHFNDYRRMGKRGVMIGFTGMGHMVSVLFRKAFSRFPLIQFTAEANSKDLQTLASLVQENKLIPRIERVFHYEEIPEAIRHIETMRTLGKVVMLWDQ
jgi:NADPH:quinone reductase-like Zn-dependent oxidoreductase